MVFSDYSCHITSLYKNIMKLNAAYRFELARCIAQNLWRSLKKFLMLILAKPDSLTNKSFHTKGFYEFWKKDYFF